MALRSLGFEVEAVEDVSSRVWTAEEQQRYEFCSAVYGGCAKARSLGAP